MIGRLAAVVVVAFIVLGGTAARAEETVEIGVLAIRGEDWAHERFDATAQYLGEQIDGYRFVIVPMHLPQTDQLVGEGRFGFVATQPANYAMLEKRHGLTRIATMRNQTPVGPLTVFGGVIFVRADRDDLRGLDDLRGHSLMAIGPKGLGGYLMAKRELVSHGLEPDDDLELEFCGFPQDRVVRAVRDREVDAGTVRTDVLERMAAEGEIVLEDFRVIAERHEAGFPYRLSTPLYPEWAFAVARSADPVLAQRVAVALLSLTPEHPASLAAQNAGWTVPLDYGPVHDLLRELHEPPYEDQGQVSMRAVWRTYWPAITTTTAVIALLLLGSLHVVRLNRRLGQSNAQLAHEIVERERAEHQLLASEKMSSLGRLAAGVAHELNTPLGFVSSNEAELAHGLEGLWRVLSTYEGLALPAEAAAELARVRREVHLDELRHDLPSILEENGVGLSRMKAIIADIKKFSHVSAVERERIDVVALAERCLAVAKHELGSKIVIERALEPELPEIEGVASQLEQLLLNFLLNARDAVAGSGTIRLGARTRDASHVEITVQDDGPGIDDDTRRRIFDPFFTTKEVGQGTGLGLAIAQRIAEAHEGHIEVDSSPGQGACFRVVLPIRQRPTQA